MTATEAYKKSLWKQLPNEIIEMINKKIEMGGTYVTLYKSVHPVFFYNKNKYRIILGGYNYRRVFSIKKWNRISINVWWSSI